MKITGIEAIPVSIPFIKPFVVWRGVAKTKDHVIVKIHTDKGITGVGEASPFLYYAPETLEDVVATIEKYMPGLVMGRDPFEMEALDRIFHQTIDGHHFSKAAVEMALWDIVGQKLGQPVYNLLGGKCRPDVPVAAILTAEEPVLAAEEARVYLNLGFTQFKIKIGFEFTHDMDKAAAVRQAIGPHCTLRVDAEECYDLKEALAAARELEKLGVELFSQPIPRHNYHDMSLLRTRTDLPILLDESIVTPEDVLLAVRLSTGDLVNIKVVKSGGILASRRMAAIAAAAGKSCLAGSMLEMGPGTLFAAHFAVSSASVSLASEIIGPLLLADDLLENPVIYSDGALQVPDTPGLGFLLDETKLKKYRL